MSGASSIDRSDAAQATSPHVLTLKVELAAGMRPLGKARLGPLDIATWGFPPPKGGRAPVTNVRNYASPMWRNSLRDPNCRCLVPFTDFCEWAGEPSSKVAHWFSTPASPISSFAGLWRSTSEGTVFAFLTCGYDGDPAAHPVGAIHPKACPVVLHLEDEDRWLTANVEDALSLACPHPSQLLSVSS